MLKLIKMLGVCVALFSSIDRASAISFETTTGSEQYTFFNTGSISITLLSVGLFTQSPINQVPSPTFSPVTVGIGGSFAEVFTGLSSGVSYTTSPGLLNSSDDTHFTESVSSVPLPAGFPLFAMALVALGSLGYFGARSRNVGKITPVEA